MKAPQLAPDTLYNISPLYLLSTTNNTISMMEDVRLVFLVAIFDNFLHEVEQDIVTCQCLADQLICETLTNQDILR